MDFDYFAFGSFVSRKWYERVSCFILRVYIWFVYFYCFFPVCVYVLFRLMIFFFLSFDLFLCVRWMVCNFILFDFSIWQGIDQSICEFWKMLPQILFYNYIIEVFVSRSFSQSSFIAGDRNLFLRLSDSR